MSESEVVDSKRVNEVANDARIDALNARYIAQLGEMEAIRERCQQLDKANKELHRQLAEMKSTQGSIIADLEAVIRRKDAEIKFQQETVQDAVNRAERAQQAVYKWQQVDRERRRDLERAQSQLLDESETLAAATASSFGTPQHDGPLTKAGLQQAGLRPSPGLVRSMSMASSSAWSSSSIGRLEKLRTQVGSMVGHVGSPLSPAMRQSVSLKQPKTPGKSQLNRAGLS
ncbi:hypothetical protein J8273_7307 [Carpediemonas membranifera]|uniref:Uncharacterized protein n=1 Tax=Carpediemonas membranifera TaxID=201153 RepID=A0A8J6AQH4_9EUKA|nr:hypothetical protein J8273_7307 [Carpediemonas membranifera]|eukprot:KAG9391033.1 hypothetical protein J8273_7307 [Carpediemonas membranifera]